MKLKNDFMLLSEIIYHINACGTLRELERILFPQIGQLIPFCAASYIQMEEAQGTGKPQGSLLFCQPASFAPAERRWLKLDRNYTDWLSCSGELTVVRDSELFGMDRMNNPAYREVYQNYQVFDAIQMNVVHEGRTVGRLTLFRNREQGEFTDRDTFSLQLLSKHINLAFRRCLGLTTGEEQADLPCLAAEYGLTRREAEVLGCIFRGMDNAEICQALSISKNTLYKHNNSIFQKCGVKSRWELTKLRV